MGWAQVRALAVAATLLVAAGCGAGADDGDPAAEGPSPTTADSAQDQDHGVAAAPPPRPLRKGEHRVTLTMPEPYTPSAPYGAGTDDYRCFLLDPGLRHDRFLTGTNVLPGNPHVVHHVILFRVPPEQVAQAQQLDAAAEGEGWTCFGGSGLERLEDLDEAPWLGAWAPGGRESVQQRGLGVPLEKGTQIVMQVHYNLLAGAEEDVSATRLRLAPPDARLTTLHTILLPAPVELPCRAGHDSSPLCDRAAAVADVRERFGQVGAAADFLHLLCGGKPRPGNTQSCTRTVDSPMTIRAAAGHMHLLGRRLRIEVEPGTDRARTVLDIPLWNFDDQGAQPVRPVHLDAGDRVKVTCTHVQWLRDKLPSFQGQPERYVVWGEGTTDEMCLGILLVTRP